MPISNRTDNNFSTVYDYTKLKKDEDVYTLDDLRNDDEFVKTSERFLESLGEGESVADMYQ